MKTFSNICDWFVDNKVSLGMIKLNQFCLHKGKEPKRFANQL